MDKDEYLRWVEMARKTLRWAERDMMDGAKLLDKYYVPTRYPNAWSEGIPADYTHGEAEQALM